MGVSLTVGGNIVELEVKAGEVDLEVKAAEVELNTCVPGTPGPVGPPGPAGGAGFTIPTEIPLGGNRAIATVNGYAVYAGSDTELEAVGISMGAASGGTDVTLQAGSKMTVTAAGWVPDEPVFLGVNGVLTQTEPVSGISQKIGVAHRSDVLLIEIAKPIILS